MKCVENFVLSLFTTAFILWTNLKVSWMSFFHNFEKNFYSFLRLWSTPFISSSRKLHYYWQQQTWPNMDSLKVRVLVKFINEFCRFWKFLQILLDSYRLMQIFADSCRFFKIHFNFQSSSYLITFLILLF